MSRQTWDEYGFLKIDPGVVGYIIVREGAVNTPAGAIYHEYNAPTWDEVVKLCIEHGFDPQYTMEIIHTKSKDTCGFMFDAEVFRANQP